MNINKAHWTTEGDNVRLSMPIGKVDVERRMVSGFATLDNVYKQDDIVDTKASIEAFKNFRGNLREMHQPSAVGKIVSFKEDRYFDPAAKKFYSGVYVSAYVSKGAQDAWEKVLDGTYSGFSIGGNIKAYDDNFDETMDKSIRIIKEYELYELSLVDNPANQFANIVSIEKVDGKNVMDGMLSKIETENVFWCKTDDIVQITSYNENSCPSCSDGMKNIGFVEKNYTDNIDTIKFLVDSAKGIKTIKMQKEESPMTEETNMAPEAIVAEDALVVENVEVAPEANAEAETPTPVTEEVVETPAEADATVTETPVAVQEEVVQVEKSEEAVAAAISDIKTTLSNAFGDLAATVKSINDQVAELTKSLSTVTNNVTDVAKEVADVKGNFNEFGKRVDAVEADTAFRKSGDLGEIVQESPQVTQKSLWGGRFLKNTDLFN